MAGSTIYYLPVLALLYNTVWRLMNLEKPRMIKVFYDRQFFHLELILLISLHLVLLLVSLNYKSYNEAVLSLVFFFFKEALVENCHADRLEALKLEKEGQNNSQKTQDFEQERCWDIR